MRLAKSHTSSGKKATLVKEKVAGILQKSFFPEFLAFDGLQHANA